MRVGYVIENPIWKTSYRLVLGKEKEDKPFLQGWAVVENATDEDWKDVRMALVSGRPISFQMDLYTPLYVPRPDGRAGAVRVAAPRHLQRRPRASGRRQRWPPPLPAAAALAASASGRKPGVRAPTDYALKDRADDRQRVHECGRS